MPHEQYVARRVDGIWIVLDRVDESTVSEHGPGSAGAEAAKAAADQLNTKHVHAGSRAAALRTWRRAHRLSQPALARHLGVQPLAISRWETGDRAIPALLERALRDLERELSPGEGARTVEGRGQ